MEHGRFVEYGSADSVIINPQADYTKRLLTDVPKIHEPWEFTAAAKRLNASTAEA
jgi:peptide/nickel transport system ATP-binding protein